MTHNQPPPALRRLKVFLWKTGAHKPTSQPCFTDMVTAGAIRIRMPAELLGKAALKKCKTIGALQKRFAKHHGAELELQLRDGAQAVWRGPVRLAGMELPREGEDMVPVTLAFQRALNDEDLRRIGLLQREAPEPVAPPPPAPVPESPAIPVQPIQATSDADPAPAAGGSNRRGADRLEATVPLALHTSSGPCEAQVQDLSRTGLRVHVRTIDLGFPPTSDLHEMAVGVGAVLAPTFTVDLHHKMLGSLLQKRVQMTRVSIAPAGEDQVEICGRFESPLLREEISMLGMPLPPEVDSGEAWDPLDEMVAPASRSPDIKLPAPRAPRQASPSATPPSEAPTEAAAVPASSRGSSGMTVHTEERVGRAGAEVLGYTAKCRYRAYLRDNDGQPVACQTDLLGHEGVRLRMPRSVCVGGGDASALGVGEISAGFRETFGREPNTKLVDGAEHLWTGPARVVALDLPTGSPTEMWVTLAFVNTLRPAEVKRLGLPVAIA